MGRIVASARRARHLAGLVGDTLARDRHRRMLRAADAALTASPDTRTADLPAAAPHPPRRLPVRSVPERTSAEHAEELHGALVALLRGAGVPHARIDRSPQESAALAVRAEDWDHALAALAGSDLPVLVAPGERPQQPRDLPFLPRERAAEASASPLLHVLSPAVTEEGGRIVRRHGFETAVRLERWDAPEPAPGTDPGALRAAPAWNPRTALLPREAFSTGPEPSPEAAEILGTPHLFEVTFPIDAVITWVDGTDPDWIQRKLAALRAEPGDRGTEASAADLRFVGHDELRHVLRSIELYAPWVRRIHLVTDAQRPDWLREDHPRLRVVDHREIAPPGSPLPVFNSHAIEANLHRIDGLSEHFLYLNDDVFLSSPVSPELFFSANGIASMFLSRAQISPGPPLAGEAASDSAGKNARALIEEACGRRLSRKLFHSVFALRRSVSYEIEERWPEAVRATRASRFRRTEDVTLSGALHMHYAFATGRAVPRGMRYRYVNIAAADAAERLDSLLRDRDVLQTFCLNEASGELEAEVVDAQVRAFLARRFPDRSTFERPEAR